MKAVVASLAATLLLAAPAMAGDRGGEAALARAIGARVAGTPVDCIDPQRVRSTQIVDGTAIVYDTGRTLYVNRPAAGAVSLRRYDVPVTRVDGGQLCRVDTVRLFDAVTRMQRGFVVLGRFVPYARPSR